MQGLSIPKLMGDWHAYVNLPALQLVLPFPWDDQPLLRLYEFAACYDLVSFNK
jgi:hypothetical protein